MEENGLIHSMTNENSQIPATIFSLEPNKTCDAKEADMGKDSWLGSKSTMYNENGKVEGEAVMVDGAGGGRERLKRHREEVAGQVLIPDKWSEEQLLKNWIDYTTFDAFFAPHRLIVTARDALIADGHKARSQRLRLRSSC